MKRLAAAICLTITVLFGSSKVSLSANLIKGWDAYQSGDFRTALREWNPLAEAGLPQAQFFLGKMYQEGQGVVQDYVYAYMWFNIVASKDYTNENVVSHRDAVKQLMTPAQIAEAQKLARECVRKKYKGC
tara:strand:- start:1251 stop:1640 length:390 start_codon:yes stop_codon:yes gene_type:complete